MHNTSVTQNNVSRFLLLLSQADAVMADGSPLLTDWDTAEATGEPENEIACFSWVDEEDSFGFKVSEGGLEGAKFIQNGTHTIAQFEDSEGEAVEIKFFKLLPV